MVISIGCSRTFSKHVLFVKPFGSRIYANSGIPERSEHPHASAVIPNGGGDTSARSGNPTHLE
jgi:hypothetical protein